MGGSGLMDVYWKSVSLLPSLHLTPWSEEASPLTRG